MAVNYSLREKWYRGVNKCCFTVALNIAVDNCKSKGCETLLKEAEHSKGGITDEQIQQSYTEVEKRLNDIRNYFSHFYHGDECLIFKKDDIVKRFMESVFATAVSNVVGGTKESDYKGVVPPLFEQSNEDYMITAAGVIFLASFFCHRSNVYRMLGAVKGFKHTGKEELSDGQKRDHGFTHRLLAHYSLRDSYSVKIEETKSFRDLLGYLSRVPQQAVDWLNERNELSEDEKKEFLNQKSSEEESPEQPEPENAEWRTEKTSRRSLRKTEKFILFAAKFIEDRAEKEKQDVTFARYQKTVTKEENKNQDGKQARVVRLKYEEDKKDDEKPREHFNLEWMYYIRNEHAIIQIKPKDKEAVAARISENELKYLVLLIFEGKGGDAFNKLSDYIFRMTQKIKSGQINPNEARLPSFLKNPVKNITDKMVRNRLDYIRGQIKDVLEKINMEEPQNNKWLIYKGKKISLVLKFISDGISDIKKRPNVKEYDTLRDTLQKLDFNRFYERLKSYVSDGRLAAALYDKIKGIDDISELCKKVCELMFARLAELEKKGGFELYRYIGMEVQEKDEKYDEWNSPQKKAERFLESQFSIGENFLRESFYSEYCQKQECIDKEISLNTSVKNRKSLVYIVKEKLKDIMPLHNDRWYLIDRNPKDFERKDSKVIKGLCNTYVQDVLCMKMARWYYGQLNPALKNNIKWDETGQGHGYDRYKLSYRTNFGITIEFKLADFTRLDIIEKSDMIENICRSFIKPNRTISWYDFKQDGVEEYRKRQYKAVRAVFAFEESLIIPGRDWLSQGFVPFIKNEEYVKKGFSLFVLDEAVRQLKIKGSDKDAMRQVRNDFFHEQFQAKDEQWKVFEGYLSCFMIDRPKGEKNKKRYNGNKK
ncbi:MAG: hypothetical protein JW804_04085 [Sedimentisphaerales bacterium]|nr:hypothetical protein [Sedimentisphaerales bacterium]